MKQIIFDSFICQLCTDTKDCVLGRTRAHTYTQFPAFNPQIRYSHQHYHHSQTHTERVVAQRNLNELRIVNGIVYGINWRRTFQFH